MEATEVYIIFYLLCNKITEIDDPRYVCNADNVGLVGFVDSILMQIDVFRTLVCGQGCPVNVGFVMIVTVIVEQSSGRSRSSPMYFMCKRSMIQASVAVISALQEEREVWFCRMGFQTSPPLSGR
jgi:hypothetical protein